ncbi:alpha/beta family hydrolase [Bdellovibrionota bacterium FG-2]
MTIRSAPWRKSNDPASKMTALSEVYEEVEIETDGINLPGTLTIPSQAAGVVLFAHGSGSSRFSPRNNQVAQMFHSRSLGTLLFDLLSENEAKERKNVFDIDLLSERLRVTTDWLMEHLAFLGRPVPVGYLGASTGAAAALIAAARSEHPITCVVSRGGRVDLAQAAFRDVRCPCLLIVGSKDTEVLELNQLAAPNLPAGTEVKVIQGATHLFEEPGTLEKVANLSTEWFTRFFSESVGLRRKI